MPNYRPRRACIDEVTAAERSLRAWKMRVRGATFRQIASELGVSVSTAHGYIDRGLREANGLPRPRKRVGRRAERTGPVA